MITLVVRPKRLNKELWEYRSRCHVTLRFHFKEKTTDVLATDGMHQPTSDGVGRHACDALQMQCSLARAQSVDPSYGGTLGLTAAEDSSWVLPDLQLDHPVVCDVTNL